MQEWQYSPTAVTVPELILDPYRCGFDAHTALSGADPGEQWGDEDWRVPPQARAAEEEAPWPAPAPSRMGCPWRWLRPTGAAWSCTRHSSERESRPCRETCTPWKR